MNLLALLSGSRRNMTTGGLRLHDAKIHYGTQLLYDQKDPHTWPVQSETMYSSPEQSSQSLLTGYTRQRTCTTEPADSPCQRQRDRGMYV